MYIIILGIYKEFTYFCVENGNMFGNIVYRETTKDLELSHIDES